MTVIFCHGLEGSPQGRKVQALRAAGLEVIAPDFQGQNLAARVATLLPVLRAHPEALVVGSSYGGITALCAAILHVEAGADGLELVPAAPGDRQLEPGRRMASGLCDVAGEVSSDQAAGEAGGAEHDDVPGAGHRGCHGRDLGSCGGVGHGAAG